MRFASERRGDDLVHAFDAAVLLVADGLVAVGRVLGGLRARCAAEKHADALAEAEESRDSWEPDELWRPTPFCGEYVPNTSSNRCLLNAGHFGNHDDDPPTSDCQDRSAAVSTPAADNTPEPLEAAYNYHRPQANYNGDLVWGCEGCNWSGPTIQAHARHRFQILADMKNATHRIQEQLGGAS